MPAPFVERVQQHVSEHVARPTVTTKQVVNASQPLGLAAGGPNSAAIGGQNPALAQQQNIGGGLGGGIGGGIGQNAAGLTQQSSAQTPLGGGGINTSTNAGIGGGRRL